MASTINRLPEGLLDLFGSKTMGTYPSVLSDTVVPVVELFDLYIAQRLERVTEGPTAVAAVGALAAVQQVPPGEIWFVRSFMVNTAALGAGQTLGIRAWASPPGTSLATADDGPCDLWARATAGVQVRATKQSFWATSGTGFGVNVHELVAGPVNVTFSWVFARFLR